LWWSVFCVSVIDPGRGFATDYNSRNSVKFDS